MMVGMTDKAHWLAAARSAMQTEAEAVLAASARLGDSLLNAVELILGPVSYTHLTLPTILRV